MTLLHLLHLLPGFHGGVNTPPGDGLGLDPLVRRPPPPHQIQAGVPNIALPLIHEGGVPVDLDLLDAVAQLLLLLRQPLLEVCHALRLLLRRVAQCCALPVPLPVTVPDDIVQRSELPLGRLQGLPQVIHVLLRVLRLGILRLGILLRRLHALGMLRVLGHPH